MNLVALVIVVILAIIYFVFFGIGYFFQYKFLHLIRIKKGYVNNDFMHIAVNPFNIFIVLENIFVNRYKEDSEYGKIRKKYIIYLSISLIFLLATLIIAFNYV